VEKDAYLANTYR